MRKGAGMKIFVPCDRLRSSDRSRCCRSRYRRTIGFSTNRRDHWSATDRAAVLAEPMIEVETAQGRVAYGRSARKRCRVCSTPGSSKAAHELCLGLTEEIPYLSARSA